MNNKAYNKSFTRDIKIIGKSDVSSRKAFPGLSADSWSRQAAVAGKALFLYLTVK